MARQTLKSMQNIIDLANKTLEKNEVEIDKLCESVRDKRSIITKRDTEIVLLRKHIGFVHAQRDRLVGFIEGRESLTEPEIIVPNTDYLEPKSRTVNRVEKFINECTLQFINADGPTVQADPFRSMY